MSRVGALLAGLAAGCVFAAGCGGAARLDPVGGVGANAGGGSGAVRARRLEAGEVLGFQIEDRAGQALGRSSSSFATTDDGLLQLVTRVELGGEVTEHALTFRRDGSPVRYKRLSAKDGRREFEFGRDGITVTDGAATTRAKTGDRVRTAVWWPDDAALLQHYLAELTLSPGGREVLDLLDPRDLEKAALPVESEAPGPDGGRIVRVGPNRATIGSSGRLVRLEQADRVFVRLATPPRLELKVSERDPGYVRPRGVRFRDEPFVVTLAEGRLVGVLSIPADLARQTAPRVLIWCSDRGLQDRDGEDPSGTAWGTRELLDAAAEEGVVAVRLDDRGTGDSVSPQAPGDVGLGLRLGDVERIVDALKKDARLEGARVVLAGQGLGGLVAVSAAQAVDAERVALIGAPARSQAAYVRDQLARLDPGASAAELDQRATLVGQALAGNAAAQGSVGAERLAVFASDRALLVDWAGLSLETTVSAWKRKVAVFQGLKDVEVAWREDGDQWAQRLRRSAGKDAVRFFAYDQVDHLMKTEPRTSTPERYADRSRRLDPRFVKDFVAFVAEPGK